MRLTKITAGLWCLAIVAVGAGSWASEPCDGHVSCVSCTGSGPCCEPRCQASWDEAKTKKPEYSMKCEYACARGRDSWHALEPDCRCQPPCGKVYVKKRLYKADGKEKVERVPKYEVKMVPVETCGSAGHCGAAGCWWNPLNLFTTWHSR